MPRGIQQVDQAVAVRELHHRGGDRDPTLLFHFHPVGFGVLAGAAAFYRTGGLDRLSEQQYFFGNGGFTGIGVRDDGESSSFGDFAGKFTRRHGFQVLRLVRPATSSERADRGAGQSGE